MRRSRNAALALVALALAAGLGQAAPWLQHGYDAGRTGATPDAGPARDDIAFQVAVPTELVRFPLVFDGAVHVLGTPDGDAGLLRTGIFRVDLATAEVHPVVELPLDTPPGSIRSWAGDGSRYFVVRVGGMDAYEVETGTLAWSWEFPPSPTGATFQQFAPDPFVRDGMVVAAYSLRDGVQNPAAPIGPPAMNPLNALPRVLVVALDATTGAERWSWQYAVEERASPTGPTGSKPVTASRTLNAVQLSAIGPYVLTITNEQNPYTFRIWTHWLDNGTFVRQDLFNTQQGSSTADPSFVDPARVVTSRVNAPPTAVVGTPDLAFVKGSELVAFDPGSGDVRFRMETPAARPSAPGLASGIAATGRAVYAHSLDTLYSIDPAAQAVTWRYEFEADEIWQRSIIVANGTVYARAGAAEAVDADPEADAPDPGQVRPTANANVVPRSTVVYAFDADAGTVLWRRPFASAIPTDRAYEYALGEGVIAVAAGDGLVTILGHTAASLQPRVSVTTLYPPPGQAVRVDLGGSLPGVGGPAAQYRADWGDGTVNEWQNLSSFEHSYSARTDYVAVFSVRNDAGQSASQEVVFHVGAEAPEELNFLQDAFSAENQNATFFILGLAGTGIGGIIGLVRYRRRRDAFARELAIIDSAYEQTRSRATECERLLAERRAHVRGLILDGKLEEGQGAVLERRIEELTRTLRMHEIEDLLDHLPRGLARALEEVLADGRVTSWERRSFLEVLANDRILAEDTKARVRAVIDGWFARDSGRTASAVREA